MKPQAFFVPLALSACTVGESSFVSGSEGISIQREADRTTVRLDPQGVAAQLAANAAFRTQLAESLRADPEFVSATRGARGTPGDPGAPGQPGASVRVAQVDPPAPRDCGGRASTTVTLAREGETTTTSVMVCDGDRGPTGPPGTPADMAVVDALVYSVSGLSAALARVLPAGLILPYAGQSAPPGWVLCDGASYNRTDPTFAALFAVVGTTYGPGSTPNDFNVPDLRGRVPVGAGRGPGLTDRRLGVPFGAESVTLIRDNLPNVSMGNLVFRSGSATEPNGWGIEGWTILNGSGSSLATHRLRTASPTFGSSRPLPLTPPGLGMSYVIKL